MNGKKKYIKFFMILFLVMFGFKTIVLADTTLSWESDSYKLLRQDLQNVFDFCKIVIPLLIIGLSVFDFIKAVAGKDDKDLKKAFNKLLKRLALAVVFFFLPTLINLLLDLMDNSNKIVIE